MAAKEAKGAGEGAGGEAPRRRSRLPIYAVLAVVLLLNGLIVGKVFFTGKAGAASRKAPEQPKVGEIVALEELIVNLSGEGDHYLKARLSIGLKEGAKAEKVEEEMAPIRDTVLSALTSKEIGEISSVRGREKLKEEIVAELNEELEGRPVVKVYFTDFTTQ